MTFVKWMVERGLSPSTAEKYAGAMTGVLSQWAIETRLVGGPLTAMESLSRYDVVCEKIAQIPEFVERNERGHNMYSAALSRYRIYLSEFSADDVESDVEAVLEDQATTATEKLELVQARIGQGKFREKLVAHWGGCAVTGYGDIRMLVASHIKPWRAADNRERLDGANGLLLLPNLDKAFDKGLITFGSDGFVQLSPVLSSPNSLGILPDMKVVFQQAHYPYLEFHRSHVFRTA